MKIALMCYNYILGNLETDIKPAQFLLTASFLRNISCVKGQKSWAQSDKGKSNLASAGPCVFILYVTAGPWLHTFLLTLLI